jgi:hypothetical protein
MRAITIYVVAYWAILSIPALAIGLLAGGSAWTPFAALQCVLVMALAAIGAIAITERLT